MQRGPDAGVGERTLWGLGGMGAGPFASNLSTLNPQLQTLVKSEPSTLKRMGFALQGGAVERECIICWAPPTVRFGCGHSFLCGGEDCLGAWLAERKPCVPALTPRARISSTRASALES